MVRETLRMRVFAGPNGSGKSTVIKNVRGNKIDFGVYVNADDIASDLSNGVFSFTDKSVTTTRKEFKEIATASGLLGDGFTEEEFNASFVFTDNGIRLAKPERKEHIAQIIADFLRKKLLAEEKKFSFETVFSHRGKLDIMQQAIDAGYKVYLYFVSTEAVGINIARVAARKLKGGHDVPVDKIKGRYIRSLDMLYDASQLAYQAFYFDNSVEGRDASMFAHFKKTETGKDWDMEDEKAVPMWFIDNYSDKIPK